MPHSTDSLRLVNGILDRMVRSGNIGPLLDVLADDVELRVAPSDGSSDTYQGAGKADVLAYFAPLADLFTFWRVRSSGSGERVLVRAEETFTIQPGGLAARTELALLFELREGLITRLVLVENPSEEWPDPERWREVSVSRDVHAPESLPALWF